MHYNEGIVISINQTANHERPSNEDEASHIDWAWKSVQESVPDCVDTYIHTVAYYYVLLEGTC